MRAINLTIIGAVALLLGWGGMAGAFHLDIYEPRVPSELLEELQDMDNPYPATPERIEAGRKIYFGKGLGVTCHSYNGIGVQLPGHQP